MKFSLNGRANLEPGSAPTHVAIVMDGNGRWAHERGLPRIEGHRAGVKRVRPLVEECRKHNIRYLTIFCFSTENWNRPELEVSALMKLFAHYLEAEVEDLKSNGIRLRAIGDRLKLPVAVKKSLEAAEEKTSNQTGLDLILALSYGGREEIVAGAKRMAEDSVAGRLDLSTISDKTFANYLYAPDVPDPDLLIRTSGEYRISNFLLWQLAYTELVVTPTFWPDFSIEEFHKCLSEFYSRKRRFGLTDEQIREGSLI